MAEFTADSILVVAETTPQGGLAKSALELLGAASQVGTPVALLLGPDTLAQELADAGASRVLVADSAASIAGADLTLSATDALASAVDLVQPDAILLSHSTDGRDIAADLRREQNVRLLLTQSGSCETPSALLLNTRCTVVPSPPPPRRHLVRR